MRSQLLIVRSKLKFLVYNSENGGKMLYWHKNILSGGLLLIPELHTEHEQKQSFSAVFRPIKPLFQLFSLLLLHSSRQVA